MPFRFEPDAASGTACAPETERQNDGMVIHQETSELSERTMVKLRGPFNIDHAAEVWQLLRESVQRYRCVLVDLSEVPHMDSAGLASLAEAHRLARQRHTVFALIGANHQVLKMLKLSGLQRVLKLYPSVAKALTSLASLDFQGDCPARSFSESLARGTSSTLSGKFLIDILPPEQRRVA